MLITTLAPRLAAANLQRYEEPLRKDEKLVGLEGLLKDGTLSSYSREGERLVYYAGSPDATNRLRALPRDRPPLQDRGVVARLKSLFIPPDLDENCSPEYGKFRMWNLLGSTCGGALGIFNMSVIFNAQSAALAGAHLPHWAGALGVGGPVAIATIGVGVLSKIASLSCSKLAKRGDVDPKKCFMISGLIGTFGNIMTVGALAAFPHAYLPVQALLAVTGAIGGVMGGAAWVNIFNHIAKGNQKGMVQYKNSLQDQLSDFVGTTALAVGVTAAASYLGVNPYAFSLCTLLPLMGLATLKGTSTLRMNAITRRDMEGIADAKIERGVVPTAPRQSMVHLLRSMWKHDPPPLTQRMRFESSIQDVVGTTPQQVSEAAHLFSIFKDEKFLMRHDDGANAIHIGLREDAHIEDAFKAYTCARLMEHALDGGKLLPALRDYCGDQASVVLAGLAHRVAVDSSELHEQLVRQGWNPGIGKLDAAKLDTAWSGPDRPNQQLIALPTWKSLVEAPDADKLATLLGAPRPAPMTRVIW